MGKSKKGKLSKKSKRRILVFGSASIGLILFLVITIGNVWAQIFQKYYEKKFYEQQLSNLKEEEEKLKVDVEKMQDDDYVARYAREKYLYSKDGEFIIQIPDDDDEEEK
jgi:cell division protein DivIC